MARPLLSLLPIPAVAVLVALSCGRTPPEEPATRLIPPASAHVAPAAGAAAVRAVADEPPSAHDVKEFERPVAK